MGIRGFIKNILLIFFCVQIFRLWFSGTQALEPVMWLAVVLFLLGLWHVLETIGVLPKLGG